MSRLITPDQLFETRVTRRSFLTATGALAVAGACLATPARAAVGDIASSSMGGELRDLSMYNQNTREHISTVFFNAKGYDRSSLESLTHFMRDHHANATHWIDPRLFTMLYDLQTIFDKNEIEVISGYRTPETNRMLSRTMPGVAKDSFHMKGQAVDIRIKGVDIGLLHDVAKTLNVGGVGYYPRANFIHIDTGPNRYWSG